MASTQATIDLIVRGSGAVNRLIQDVNQLLGAVDRINSRTLDVAPANLGRRAAQLEATMRGSAARANDLGKDRNQILSQQRQAIDRLTQAQLSQERVLNRAATTEGKLERLAKRDELASRRTNQLRDALRQSTTEAERFGDQMAEASASAGQLQSRLNAIRQATRQANKDTISAAAGLIDINQTRSAGNTIRALAAEYNKYGDSLRRSATESNLVERTLPKQINTFSNLRNEIEQAELSLENLRSELSRLGRTEVALNVPPPLAVSQKGILSPSALAESSQRAAEIARIQQENESRQQRNARRAEISAEIAAGEKSLVALEGRASKLGETIAKNQSKAATMVANRDPAKQAGFSVSLNQIQAQAESLALVANNSAIASTAFNRFTVAAEMASIKLARAQQNTFTALAAGFSGGGGVRVPQGLGNDPDIAGARSMVGQLIADIPGLTRSEAALNAHLQLLNQIRSLLPFLSNEYRAVEEAIAGLNQELQGVSLRGQASAIQPAAGPATDLGSVGAFQKREAYEKRVSSELTKQAAIEDKIAAANLNENQALQLRNQLDQAATALAEGRLTDAQRITGEINRQRVAMERLNREKGERTFGTLGTNFMPITGKLPGQRPAPGSPAANNAALRTQLSWQTALSQMEEVSKQIKSTATAKGAKIQMDWNLAFEKAKDIVASATASLWKTSGGPALPPWMNQKTFGTLGTSFMPVSGKMPSGALVPGSPRDTEQAAKAAKELAAQQIVFSKLQKQYTLEEGKGVEFLQEKVQLGGVLDALAKGQVASTKANVTALGQNIKYFRDLLGLRVLEAKVAGAYQKPTADQLEDRRARLLSRALGVQSTTIALEARGAQVAQEKQGIEAAILRLKQLQGQATEEELRLLLKQIQSLKIAGQEISNTLPPGQGAGKPGKTPFLEKLTSSPRISAAFSEGLIGGAFPLLFGQGVYSSVLGGLGGAAGGFLGGGLGFGLSLIGTAIGTALEESEKLDKELAKVNTSAEGVGNTSADIEKLSKALGIAKEEAVKLLSEFRQFGSPQVRKDLALALGGERTGIFNKLESAVKEQDILQAIAAARGEITNQEAISLVNAFKTQGALKAQIALTETLLKLGEKEAIQKAKVVSPMDRLSSVFAMIGASYNPSFARFGKLKEITDPKIFGEDRAKKLQDEFDKRREEVRKTIQDSIKESQKFFKEFEKENQKSALASSLLGAIESRNEAIDSNRKQREEQIANIRKQAVEAAAQIEKNLAKERTKIEREIEDIRRKGADDTADAALRLRELRGESPDVIEAERELLAISRRDRDARIELERRLDDEERSQAETIADFQRGVAKQIQETNLASARAMGEIQSNYAKRVAKIIEEGSDKAGKRLAKAAEMVSLYTQRSALNTTIGRAAGLVIPERTNGVYNFGPQGSRSKEQVRREPLFEGLPTLIDNLFRIDDRLERLKKDLNMSRKPGIGQQFTALLGAEKGFEDIAGLQPLPIARMRRQAARPFLELWKTWERFSNDIYGPTKQEIKRTVKPDPARHRQVLERIKKMQTTIDNYDPVEAKWKEIDNKMREVKRSKPATMSATSLVSVTEEIYANLRDTVRKAGGLAVKAGERLGSMLDFSDYASPQQSQIIGKGVREVLGRAYERSIGLGGDVNAFNAAIDQLAPLTRKFGGLIEQVLQVEARAGYVYAEKALKKLGLAPMPAARPEDRQNMMDRLDRIYEQPHIIPGVQNRIEGASLFGTGFDVSKIATDFGTIAAASILRGVLDTFESRGATGRTEVAQAGRSYRVGDEVGRDFALPGSAATTRTRETLKNETLRKLDTSIDEALKIYLATPGAEGVKIKQSLEEQNRLLILQVKYLNDGIEPSLARQLATLEDTYELSKKDLENRRIKALQAGWNADAVKKQHKEELASLTEIFNKNKNLTIEYARQAEFLEGTAALMRQIVVTGAAQRAGFFGAGASAYTTELLRTGGNVEQATDLAKLTRAQEVAQAIAGLRDELNLLLDPTNGIISAASAIGNAFSESFRSIVSGSASAEDALANLFQRTADHFLDMAAKMIAKQIEMKLLGIGFNFFGGILGGIFGGGSSGGGSLGSLAENLNKYAPLPNASGNAFSSSLVPFAMGGAFSNSVVNSPTLFKFANGGALDTGVMGESGPEAVMPLSRGPDGSLGIKAYLDDSRAALAGGRPQEESAAAFADNQEAIATASAAQRERYVERVLASSPSAIEVKYSRVSSGDLPFVTEEDMLQASRAAVQEGAKLGERRALATLRTNPAARRSTGI